MRQFSSHNISAPGVLLGALKPPFTLNCYAVMCEAAFDARKMAAPARSRGFPHLRSGTLLFMRSKMHGEGRTNWSTKYDGRFRGSLLERHGHAGNSRDLWVLQTQDFRWASASASSYRSL